MRKKLNACLGLSLLAVFAPFMWAQPSSSSNYFEDEEISFPERLELNPHHILSPEELGVDSEDYAILVVKKEVVLRFINQIRTLLPQACENLEGVGHLIDLLKALEYGITDTRGVVEDLTTEWQDRADPDNAVDDNAELDSPEIDFFDTLNDDLHNLIEEKGDNSVYSLAQRIEALAHQGNVLPANVRADCDRILDLIDQRFRALIAHLNPAFVLAHYDNTTAAFEYYIDPLVDPLDPTVLAAHRFAEEGLNLIEDFRLHHTLEEQNRLNHRLEEQGRLIQMLEEEGAGVIRNNRRQNRQNRMQAGAPYQSRVQPSPSQVNDNDATGISLRLIPVQPTHARPLNAFRILNNRIAQGVSCASEVGNFSGF